MIQTDNNTNAINNNNEYIHLCRTYMSILVADYVLTLVILCKKDFGPF